MMIKNKTIENDCINLIKKIGEGGCGMVFEAEY